MASKGGARHFSKPMVDPFVLFQTLNQHVSLVSSLGRYETVSRQQATDAKGLVHCLPLLEFRLSTSRPEDRPKITFIAIVSQLIYEVQVRVRDWALPRKHFINPVLL